MATFISSDHHFLHERILTYVPSRPSNHNSVIFNNHNNVITNSDDWICLGDLSAGVSKVPDGKEKLKKILSNLNGKRKILIRGNHDHYPDSWYKDCGFDIVCYYLIQDGVMFCHYALENNEWTGKFEKRLKEIFFENNCHTLYHGHTHCRMVELDDGIKRINCCLDANNYLPIEL